jgi:hypothetical protein
MTSPVDNSATIQVVRPNRTGEPHPSFVSGEGVVFLIPNGEVCATVIGLDTKARADLPLGLPYRLIVRDAPPECGYEVGCECTVRAGCLGTDANAPPPPPLRPLRAAPVAAPPTAPSLPLFLVAFLREGGNVPVQGTVLVEGESLQAASTAATTMLTAELEADVRERGELPEARIMLLNAAEVPPLQARRATANAPILATVRW